MNDESLGRSATREIDKKLDDLVEKVTRIDERLSRQPLIDEQKEKVIEQRFEDHGRRISGLEANQRWTVLAVVTLVLTAIAQIIFK